MPAAWRTTSTASRSEPARPLRRVASLLSWLAPLPFVLWAARLAVLEGYVYPSPDFSGDFTRTITLATPWFFDGHGIFYGPLFVLEYRYLFAPGILSKAGFAALDFVLFGVACACAWLALFGARRPRLAMWVLAAWLVHHASIEAFANTAHLEMLELMLMSAALLCATRGRPAAAGGLLGLAMATKILPGVFLPFLAITRQWRMLMLATGVAGLLFLAVCWLQQVSPADGLVALVYQGGNLTNLQITENQSSLRADFGRVLAGDSGELTPDQVRLAIAAQWLVAGATLAVAGVVLARLRLSRHALGLFFGVVITLMLIASPSAHIRYDIFLLLTWTAVLADLLRRPRSVGTGVLWLALAAGYTFTGFDQPFFLSQRLLGVGLVVPQNWLVWHLPSLALLVTWLTALVCLASTGRSQPRVESGLLDRGGQAEALQAVAVELG